MWQEKEDALVKEYSFADFKAALDFVNKVGALAERENHHPDVQLGWGKVVISLTTHSEGGVTDKDRQMSKFIDKIG